MRLKRLGEHLAHPCGRVGSGTVRGGQPVHPSSPLTPCALRPCPHARTRKNVHVLVPVHVGGVRAQE